MTIGRRLRDPIKVVSITCDTAIDREKTPLLDYTETRDERLVHAMTGEELTWWTLRPLSGDLPERCRAYGAHLAERAAFTFACIGCSDLSLVPPDSWTGDGDYRRLKNSVVDILPDQLRRELGDVALRLGELTVGEERSFGLPVGLLVTRTPRRSTTAESVNGNEAPGER